MSITFPCPKCQSPITPDMNNCTQCGTELVPIAIKSQPIANPDSYGYYNSNRTYYQPKLSYNEKGKANILVAILFVIFLGLLSAFGYYMIATHPHNPKMHAVGVLLIIISIALNIVIFFL